MNQLFRRINNRGVGRHKIRVLTRCQNKLYTLTSLHGTSRAVTIALLDENTRELLQVLWPQHTKLILLRRNLPRTPSHWPSSEYAR